MELKIPENSDLLKPKGNNKWDKFNESAKVECVCGNIIQITSCYKGYHTVQCNNCDLVYNVWNNSDGSGTRFNVKGYPPFYDGGFDPNKPFYQLIDDNIL